MESKKARLREIQRKEEETQDKLSRVRTCNAQEGNMCRNCHLRLGHTARSCTYGKCVSVYSCGEEKFHPSETKTKQLRSTINKLKNEIANIERNIGQKQEASDHLRQTLSNKIEQTLLQEDKTEYIENGHKSWPLLRRHVYLIESYCKKNFWGKIPPKHKLSDILSCAVEEREINSTTTTFLKQVKLRGNPAKQVLQSCGINFPVHTSSSHPCGSDITSKSSVYRCAPENEEESEQLQMVLKQSMFQVPATPVPMVQPRATVVYQPVFPHTYHHQNYTSVYNPLSIDEIFHGSDLVEGPSVSTSTVGEEFQQYSETETLHVTHGEDQDTETAQLLLSLSNNSACNQSWRTQLP